MGKDGVLPGGEWLEIVNISSRPGRDDFITQPGQRIQHRFRLIEAKLVAEGTNSCPRYRGQRILLEVQA